MSDTPDEIELQRRYYTETADRYDAMHLDEDDEHFFALSFLTAMLDALQIDSVLDIGSGTGRVIHYLTGRRAGLRVTGVEPVQALRQAAYAKGLPDHAVVDGDATDLQFACGEFDLVCAFGVLHHVRRPERAIAEMLRVAGKAIFISDANNFGQGSAPMRAVKQLIDFLGLWKLADLMKTRGKGYTITEGDGLAYSYSVFNNYKQIRRQCQRVHLLNTKDGHANLYRSAGHVALLGIKK